MILELTKTYYEGDISLGEYLGTMFVISVVMLYIIVVAYLLLISLGPAGPAVALAFVVSHFYAVRDALQVISRRREGKK